MECRLESQLRKFKSRIEQRRYPDQWVPPRAPEPAG